MEPQKAAANPITEGVIWKQLLTFFFPIMIGTFFQQLYNTADAVIVGQYLGKTALAATGGTSSVLIHLLVMFFINLSSGASVVISQYYGARKEKELKDTLHTAIALALTGGLILSVIGVSCTPAVLRFLHSPEDVLPLAVIYLRVYFSGMIAVLVYNIGSAILRAVGDSRRPLYFLIVACFINILLDLLFVAVFHFGIAGASAATVIAQGISALLVLRTLLTTREVYKLTLKDIRVHPRLLKRILFIGFPAGVQSSMFNISNIIIQSTLNGFGTDIVAAWTAFNKLDAIFWMGSNAFGVSIMT
ncbi:MAG: MATE family efflux transporter, partial [Lachnospiraceae bacterium]|nr:MATE family efflux transporter [Lachnospiraceae bacterium]